MEYATANTTIYQGPYSSIRQFKPVNDKVTTVLVSAIAGHLPQFSLDFEEGKSVAGSAVKWCEGGVISIHIDAPTAYSRYVVTYNTWLEQIAHAIEFIGTGPVRLVGICQGGALAAVFATRYPHLVAELVVVAAPINTSTPSELSPTQKIPYATYHGVVLAHGWIMPGKVLGDAWYDYNKDEHDEAKKDPKNAHFYACYADVQSIDPMAYLEMILKWFLTRTFFNELDIACPVTTIAGLEDEFTPVEQVEAIERRCKYPIKKLYTSRGHMSTFASEEAHKPDGVWSQVFQGTNL
jgi:pimeloyl-ACP methyl ester carboxylesterase